MIELILLIIAIGMIVMAGLNWAMIQAIITENMNEIEKLNAEKTKRERPQQNRDKQ